MSDPFYGDFAIMRRLDILAQHMNEAANKNESKFEEFERRKQECLAEVLRYKVILPERIPILIKEADTDTLKSTRRQFKKSYERSINLDVRAYQEWCSYMLDYIEEIDIELSNRGVEQDLSEGARDKLRKILETVSNLEKDRE